MNIQQFFEFCLSKKATSEHFPFDSDTLVLKVGSKVFALSSLQQWENCSPTINLKCDPEKAELLRAEYDGIKPGFHMNKRHWNTVSVNQDVSDALVCKMITESYDLVLKSLTKKAQAEIEELEN